MLTQRCELQLSSPALEQRATEFGFQRGNACADSGLSQIERLGCAGEQIPALRYSRRNPLLIFVVLNSE